MTDKNVACVIYLGQLNKCIEHSSIHYMVTMWETNSLAEGGQVLVAANSMSSNHHLIA
jgi:hypothetical protein